ncbi:MAG: hypothetical protein MK212_18960 [Saprospiraceae bacterium]|nr:hypothetical protein [Saprospiraceae bacterium]
MNYLIILFLFNFSTDNNALEPYTAQSNFSIIDTIFYSSANNMVRIPFFIEKKTPIEKRLWKRQIYNLKGNLLAEGNIKLTKKRFKIPTLYNYSLIGHWIYYDHKGSIIKERHYEYPTKNPEMISKTIGNFSVSIW